MITGGVAPPQARRNYFFLSRLEKRVSENGISSGEMRLSASARKRLSVVLADLLGEPADVAEEVAVFLGGYIQRVPIRAALGLRLVIWAIGWLPILFVARPLPAHLLSPAVRARYLAAWAQSPFYLVREGFFLFKAIALMGWGSIDRVRRRLGVEPLLASASQAARLRQ
jgi:hypothetical protein